MVGCSGTGSIVILQLAHLGAGQLVPVDPDVVEEKNLNRIPGASMQAALNREYKVDVAWRYIEAVGLGTEVTTIASQLGTPAAVRAIAECDIVFGCMVPKAAIS